MDLLSLLDYPKICRLCLNQEKVADNLIKINKHSAVGPIIEKRLDLNIIQDSHLPQNICKQCHNKLCCFEIFVVDCQQSDQKLRLHYEMHYTEPINNSESSDILPLGYTDENWLVESLADYDTDMADNAEFLDLKGDISNVFGDYSLLYSSASENTHIDSPKINNDFDLEVERAHKKPEDNKSIDDVCKEPAPSISPDNSSSAPDDVTDSKDNALLCQLCDRSFTTIKQLTRHKKMVHSTKMSRCPKCGKEFKCLHYLRVHQKRIHENGGKKIQCRICNASLGNKSSLQRHLATHTGIKPHVCNLCDRGFSLSQNLKIHLRTHTNENPYKCETCGTHFRYMSIYKGHLMKTECGKKFDLDKLK